MWLDFFNSKNHLVLESVSLVPKNDNSLLWINSGVATLKKYFSGQENPPKNRLTNSQRCIRTNDIQNVGITSRHHTFFEMLGNFSIGDYFRTEAIEMCFEFLTSVLQLDINKLYITVYEQDEQTYNLWVKLGILKSHIIKCSKDRNFWEIGQGPCGPCTEIFYDRGLKFDPNNIGEKLFFEDVENDRYIEILNIVFSEFENDGNGNYKPLIRKNIDTGAGLERLACIMQNVNTNYDIDVYKNVRDILEKHSAYNYDDNLYFASEKDPIKVIINKSFSVIIDHLRAAIFAISDGVIPSNKDRGYIIRKLLRISFIYLDVLQIENSNLSEIINSIINSMNDYYTYLNENKNRVIELINSEYVSHQVLLKKSINQFVDLVNSNQLTEQKLFTLVDTHGFPVEIIKELETNNNIENINFIIHGIASKFNHKIKPINNINIDFDVFNKLFDNHRIISKSNFSSSMDKQNSNLMNLDVDSKFDYDAFYCESKIIQLFDKDFNKVDSINSDSGYLVLDKTCFYATSGGQLNDVGYIDRTFIDDVFKAPNGQHVHHFKDGTFKIGQEVKCNIDVATRKILTAHHSLEHLLHSALKRKINMQIKQEGALKSVEKVTFDFSYHKKLDINEIKTLEQDIKDTINNALDSETFLLTLQEAQDIGALAYFENVYKKIKGKLRVVKLGNNSIEICGGTHVKNTKEIENCVITKIESKGSGSWRIEALATNKLIETYKNTVIKKYLDDIQNYFKEYELFVIKSDNFNQFLNLNFNNMHFIEIKNYLDAIKKEFNIIKFQNEKNELESQQHNLKNKLTVFNEKVNLIELENINNKLLMQTLTNLINEKEDYFYVVINKLENSYQYLLCTNEKNMHDDILKRSALIINDQLKGKGGGRNNFIQGNFNETNQEVIKKTLNEIIKNIDFNA